jgi:hypothetical protein
MARATRLLTRRGRGRYGTLWYYRPLANTFGTLGPGRFADELDRVIGEIERLATEREVVRG